jgi:hypothetical protein
MRIRISRTVTGAALLWLLGMTSCAARSPADPQQTAGRGSGIQTSGARHCARMRPLSSAEKAVDMQHLLTLARYAFPYLDTIQHFKAVRPLGGRQYVDLARRTKDNQAFVGLLAEVVQLLEQGTGHMDITSPWTLSGEDERRRLRALYGISDSSLRLQDYWWRLLIARPRRTHADAFVHYERGEYLLTQEFLCGGMELSPGTRISSVDGRPVHEYARSLADQVWLRYDADNRRPFFPSGSPFDTFGDTRSRFWRVVFHRDGADHRCELMKRPGRRPTARAMAKATDDNLITIRLTSDVGYIRISAFRDHASRRPEVERLRSFLADARQSIAKLIIDVRRNSGGAPTYWQEALVPALLPSERQVTAYSAMRRPVQGRMRNAFARFRREKRRDFSPGSITEIDAADLPTGAPPEYFKRDDWVFFRTTKSYAASGPGYRGQVYVLVDNDCFSATEDFVRTARALRLGRIVGARTGGGAANTIAPWVFELPNSHVLLLMQVEASFNPDGTLNDPLGTRPDFELSRSTYPTPFPRAFDISSLRADPWIAWVLEQ